MGAVFDFEKLNPLLNSFQQLSGIRFSLVDTSYRVIYASGEMTDFCACVQSTPAGLARCNACDEMAARNVGARTPYQIYRCHAGLCDILLPIGQGGEVIAYLCFGQLLDTSQPIEAQWRATLETLGWADDAAALEGPFLRLPMLDMADIEAYARILSACIPYIQIDGLVQLSHVSELQRLRALIDRNYHLHLTLDQIAVKLNVSKTKLCSIAAENGSTVMRMLAEKRISVARVLLVTTDLSVSAVAERVGISDYNYFTKVFKSIQGTTPSRYRQNNAKDEP